MKKILILPLLLFLLVNCSSTSTPSGDNSGGGDDNTGDQVNTICENTYPNSDICKDIKDRIQKNIFTSGSEYIELNDQDDKVILDESNSSIDLTKTQDIQKGWTVNLTKEWEKNIGLFSHNGERTFNMLGVDKVKESYYTDKGNYLNLNRNDEHESGGTHSLSIIVGNSPYDISPGVDLNTITQIFEVYLYEDDKGGKFYAYGPPIYITHK